MNMYITAYIQVPLANSYEISSPYAKRQVSKKTI